MSIKNSEVPIRDGDDGYYGRIYENHKGVDENNSTGPDLPNLELKSKRPGSSSKTTLFSLEPSYDINEEFTRSKDLLHKFKNADGKLNTGFRVGTPNNRGFYCTLSPDEGDMFLCVDSEPKPICRWDMQNVLKRAQEKMPNMDFARWEDIDTYHEIKYRGFSVEGFKSLLLKGDVAIELRMKEGKNRGTAFRINYKKLKALYRRIEK